MSGPSQRNGAKGSPAIRCPVHDLADLADLAGQTLDPLPRQLQVFAVEARVEEGPFPLPAERRQLLALLEAELRRCENALAGAD